MRPLTQSSLLNLTAYLAVGGVAVSGVLRLELILQRWLVILLLLAFIFLHSRLPHPETPSEARRANILIGVQTLIVAYLIGSTGAVSSFLILLFILSVSAAFYNPLRHTLVWLAIFTAITAWAYYQDGGWQGLLQETAVYTGGFLFFSFITNALSIARRAQTQNERLLAELRAKNAQLEDYARQVETLAAVEERNRLAREVHDTLGHRLTSSVVQLEAAQRLVPSDPGKAAELLGIVRTEVRAALSELRQTVGRLRDPVEAELSLPQALRRLADGFRSATGLTVHLQLPENPCEFSPERRLALYRTAQEGLTNVQRHAQARQVWLTLTCSPDELQLVVQDDGGGPTASQPTANGFGLRGLQERAAALGGQITLGAHPDGGAVLTMRLPNSDPVVGGSHPALGDGGASQGDQNPTGQDAVREA